MSRGYLTAGPCAPFDFHLGRRMTATLLMVLGRMVASTESVASEPRTLSARTYLDLMAQRALPLRRHAAQQPSEVLALCQGEEWYVPDVTLSSRWEDETRRDPHKTEQRGLTSNLDTVWTSLMGTEVSLGLEYQYGEQESALPSGLPEGYQENQQVSLDVQQPILHGFTLAHNRIPIELAREGWESYRNNGRLQQLEVQQGALNELIELQRLAYRLMLEQAFRQHYETLLETTEALWLEGQSTELDVQLARLDLQEQEGAVSGGSSQGHR